MVSNVEAEKIWSGITSRVSATSDELSGQLSAMLPIVERPHGVATAHIDRDISKRIGRDGVVV
jgi:hypothetical protein